MREAAERKREGEKREKERMKKEGCKEATARKREGEKKKIQSREEKRYVGRKKGFKGATARK